MEAKSGLTVRVGIVSDTHGLLRPSVIDNFRGVDAILHAGDAGSQQVLDQLGALAPVTAIRGNVDTGSWANNLPASVSVELGGVHFFLIHNIQDLRSYPPPEGTQVVLFGHSHKPSQVDRDGVCYLNPGSAGPRRFSLPISLVVGELNHGTYRFSFVQLS